jgi:hypothetical protein
MSNLFFIFALSITNNMDILFYILCGGSFTFGLVLGKLIRQSIKPKCNHVREKIESGDIHRYENGKPQQKIGWVKVYECQRCKKMRKEQVFL